MALDRSAQLIAKGLPRISSTLIADLKALHRLSKKELLPALAAVSFSKRSGSTRPSSVQLQSSSSVTEPVTEVSSSSLQETCIPSQPTHRLRKSVLFSFLLGSGAGLAGSAAYGSKRAAAVHHPEGQGSSSSSDGGQTWEDVLRRALGGLWGTAAAASAVAVAAPASAGSAHSEAADGAAASPFGPHFIADAAEKAAPAVVNVTVNHANRGHGYGMFSTKSSGSGFIIDSSGVILTNAHVVLDASGRQPAKSITITLQDGRIFEGEVRSFDRVSDLAVVKVSSREPLPVAKLGSSSGLRVGEWVVSLGSPLHLQNSVTCGIISCVDRKAVDLGLAGACPEYIQTDASINQGSSGGPLINLAGEVIGVTSMKALAADGVSFAIPIDTAKNVVKQLSEQGRVVRPYLGIKMLVLNPMISTQLRQRDPDFPDVESGILVVQVTVGSPADRAGLQAGDVIVEFHGRTQRPSKGNMSADLIEALSDNVGSPITLKVLRTERSGAAKVHSISVTASEAISRD
mmetsp:Transcript_12974/g.30779  ORF Transcript_12974/g.30779 Transcript_12974/m.30779 type:complete len:516 (+) Transcript_12974:219-1766(+)